MKLNYKEARFAASYGTSAQLPASTRPEISFVGRSNVGKSSIMNKVFARKNLVKVSSTPGKTSTINFFPVGPVDFVDLPGYGYAQVAKSDKGRWSELIEGYFAQDRRFTLVCALIDIRHDASALDVQMVEFLADRELPFALVFTKADKVGKNQQMNQVRKLCEQLVVAGDVPVLVCSSLTGQGVDDVRALIEDARAQFGK